MHPAKRSSRCTLAVIGVSGLVLAAAATSAQAATASLASTTAASPSVSLADPAAAGSLTAGTVTFRGSTSAGLQTKQTSVLFLVDVSGSTSGVKGQDCNGDGEVTDADDVNRDGASGDVLDCEIEAVKSLNHGLAGIAAEVADVRVGLTAFAANTANAVIGADGSAFVTLRDRTTESVARVDVVADSLKRHEIGQYVPSKRLSNGSNFDAAMATAISSLGSAPGTKWVMLLSDGLADVSPETLANLSASGIKVRSFAVGAAATCAAGSSLAQIAGTTGETCVAATSPSSLPEQILAAQPASLASVTLTVGSTTVDADVDAIGSWTARMDIGAGDYTATAQATSTTGATTFASRAFTVVPATLGGGSGTPTQPGAASGQVSPPEPGYTRLTVGTTAPTRPLTILTVATPASTTSPVPARVTGRVVGSLGGMAKSANGAVVRLQKQRLNQHTWTTVATTRVSSARFTLVWRVDLKATRLRVWVPAQQGLPSVVAPVARPALYGCSVAKHRGGARWTTVCHTTIARSHKATLAVGRHVIASSKVVNGKVTLVTRLRAVHPVLRVVTTVRHSTSLRL